MKRSLVFLSLFVIAYVLSSCLPLASSDPTNLTESEIDQSYPAKDEFVLDQEIDYESSYPLVTELVPEEEINLKKPTPNAFSGIVYGKLLNLNNEEPVQYSKVYLGTENKLGTGEEYIISFLENSSPNSLTSQSGEFLITDIPPGRYIPILVTPISYYPILDSIGEKIEIVIDGGQLIDLGLLYTVWPSFD